MAPASSSEDPGIDNERRQSPVVERKHTRDGEAVALDDGSADRIGSTSDLQVRPNKRQRLGPPTESATSEPTQPDASQHDKVSEIPRTNGIGLGNAAPNESVPSEAASRALTNNHEAHDDAPTNTAYVGATNAVNRATRSNAPDSGPEPDVGAKKGRAKAVSKRKPGATKVTRVIKKPKPSTVTRTRSKQTNEQRQDGTGPQEPAVTADEESTSQQTTRTRRSTRQQKNSASNETSEAAVRADAVGRAKGPGLKNVRGKKKDILSTTAPAVEEDLSHPALSDPWKAVNGQGRAQATRSSRRSSRTAVTTSRKKQDKTNTSQQEDAEAEAAQGHASDLDQPLNSSNDGPAAHHASTESVRQKVKATTRARRRKQPAAPESTTEIAGNQDEINVAGEGNEDAESSISRTQSSRRQRSHSLSDDEDHRIDIKETSMWDLTKDSRKGQVSKLERAFRKIDWGEVKRRKEEEDARAMDSSEDEANGDQPDQVTERLDRADQQAQQSGGAAANESAPSMKVVNGQLVFDTSTTNLENEPQAAAEAEAAAVDGASNADYFEESELTNRINTTSWAKANKRHRFERISGRHGRWNVESTDKFYKAIQIFGADFTIIQKMFPTFTRRQVKLKFVREEKTDPARIKEAMVGPTSAKQPMSIALYAEMTGKDESLFKDPTVLNKELEVEREKQQQELEQERVDLEENVKKKRERARERQKEKEKERRERRKKDKLDAAAGGANEADDVHASAAGSPGADTGIDHEQIDEGGDFHDGNDEVTQSIEA